MTIHHATLKKAQKHDIEIVESFDDDGSPLIEVSWGEKGSKRTFVYPWPAKLALETMLTFRSIALEYPQVEVRAAKEDGSRWAVSCGGETIKAPTLAEAWKKALADSDFCDAVREAEKEAEAEEEERVVSSISVLRRYREVYAERGNPNHCGDWIALQLEGQFVTSDPETGRPVFDHEAFAAMLIENGVDMSGKWADLPNSGTRGWQGRYRMNGRQKLEVVVAKRGTLLLNGEELVVPKDVLAELRKRHDV